MTETADKQTTPKPRPPRTPLGMALAVAMARDGWQLTDLAAATGVSRSALDRIVREGRTSSDSHLSALIAYLERRGWALLLVTEPLERVNARTPWHTNRGTQDVELQMLNELGRQKVQAEVMGKPFTDPTHEVKRFFELARLAAKDSEQASFYRRKLTPGDYEALCVAYEVISRFSNTIIAGLYAEMDTADDE